VVIAHELGVVEAQTTRSSTLWTATCPRKSKSVEKKIEAVLGVGYVP
jgi:hypothetical protein